MPRLIKEKEKIHKSSGIALMIIGAILLMAGSGSPALFVSAVSQFFSGSPIDRSMVLLADGGVATVLGFASLFEGKFSSN